MEKAIIDAQQALKVIENNKNKQYTESDFQNYTPCYIFSNENINEYCNENIGKTILTVCASGDQALSAILFGAKHIDNFDSNPLTYYTMMLKLYLIKNVDYETFLEFYELKETKKEKQQIYDTIKEKIDKKEIRIFWDIIFQNPKNIKYIYKIDKTEKYIVENPLLGIPYLKKENYEKLQKNLENYEINFITCDILEIFEHYKNKYDFINYSNILQYIDDRETLLKFIKLIIKSKEHLNENGTIIINYSWNKTHTSESLEHAFDMMEIYNINPKQKNINAPIENEINSIIYTRTQR